MLLSTQAKIVKTMPTSNALELFAKTTETKTRWVVEVITRTNVKTVLVNMVEVGAMGIVNGINNQIVVLAEILSLIATTPWSMPNIAITGSHLDFANTPTKNSWQTTARKIVVFVDPKITMKVKSPWVQNRAGALELLYKNWSLGLSYSFSSQTLHQFVISLYPLSILHCIIQQMFYQYLCMLKKNFANPYYTHIYYS